ncbi:protein FANTASTIC FOUR 1-like [Argentina anserina]|uniref:protein FANTASTIC FOUR 1-like n=1 Tax=Argentina anserina TaxID=57926 RepID=UPI0021764E9B|nr:protein FANTASTIC FOUR 1-like [Potentilla anserina]
MSSTTVCHQELQLCVESLVKLQLVPAKPTEVVTIPETQEVGETSDKTSWSFLQAFTTVIQNPKTETETEEVYVHPLDKRSALVLSPRSLEMCTENLGSETGCDESSDDMSFPLLQSSDIPVLSLEAEKTPTFSASEESIVETPRLSETDPSPKRLVRRVNGRNNFPPPLTSLSDSNGVQLLPRRESGRLVLKAVHVTSPGHYFEAERGDGRLRLRLLMDMPLNSEEVEEDDDEEEDEAVKEDKVVEEMMEVETKTCREEEEEAMGVEAEDRSGVPCETEEEEMEENAEMEEKLRSRCKEYRRGNDKVFMNWPPESFKVAT